jgi:uncharacterized membrane protein
MQNKKNQYILLLVLALSSAFSVCLSFIRVYASGTNWFLFLDWNLFLAWIPLVCSTVSLFLSQKKDSSVWLKGLFLFVWFIFFPNCPYIITDLFHLRIEQTVPLWFDVALIFSFVWNGLVLGFVSLLDIQFILEKKLKKVYSWSIVSAVLVLAGFGIYLGRYLRWNSWDIVQHPILLFRDIIDRIVDPLSFPRTYSVTIIFSLFLIVSYSVFRCIALGGVRYQEETKPKKQTR